MKVQLRFKRYEVNSLGAIGYKCATNLPGRATFYSNSLTKLVENIETEFESYGLINNAVNNLFDRVVEIDVDIKGIK